MGPDTRVCVIAGVIVAILATALIRLIHILPATRQATTSTISKKLGSKHHSLMILLGSGGHTGEMMRMVGSMELEKSSRTWLVSSGDTTSLEKAKTYEELLLSLLKSDYVVLQRARRVGESLFLSFFSTMRSIASTATQLWNLPKPDVLLVNGPGTSVPVAYVLFVMKFFGLCHTRIIYIESLARVNGLSLSGQLLLPIADRFLVQWAPLAEKYYRAEYYGILI